MRVNNSRIERVWDAGEDMEVIHVHVVKKLALRGRNPERPKAIGKLAGDHCSVELVFPS